MPCVWGLDSVDTKWLKNIYVEFLVGALFLLRVSLQAENCAWPWLNINSKKGAYQGTSLPSAFYLIFVLGDATDWTWLDNWLFSEEIWFLLVLLGTSSASTCCLTFVCLYCWLTLHGFGPSAAFKFQARVCADISCITNVTLVLIPFFLCLVFACFNMFLHFLGGFEQKLGSEGKGILKLNPPSMELSKSMGPDHGSGLLYCSSPSPHGFPRVTQARSSRSHALGQ